ncbi:SRPBCC family protein [Mycobacterium sp. NPDC003323]
MHASASVQINAPALDIWNVVADIRNTGKFSPETFDAEWLDGVTGPELGARFRGHVKRNEIGPVYWTTCRVTACTPGEEFGFEVLIGDRAVNNWHYEFEAQGDATRVTESFHMPGPKLLDAVMFLRKRRNERDMATTLGRIKTYVEQN